MRTPGATVLWAGVSPPLELQNVFVGHDKGIQEQSMLGF